MKCFVIRDVVSGMHDDPMFVRTRGEATRGWTDVCNDPKTKFFQHPKDFVLLEIGELDQHTGKLTPYSEVHLIGSAEQFKRKVEDEPTLPMNGLDRTRGSSHYIPNHPN